MSQPLRSVPPDSRAEVDPRIAEPERRIALLDAEPDERFGRFGAADWAVLWVFAVALPILGLWRCAG